MNATTTSNVRNHADSSMSIPIYEGSMVSVRSNSRVLTGNSNGLRYKSANDPNLDIKWKFGKLDKKYECNHCKSYLKGPYKLTECGHRVCSSCFMELIKKCPSCPTCSRPIGREKAVVDSDLQREILNLPIYCSYNLSGCRWEGVFKSLLTHLEECEYAMVECPRGCGLKYQKRAEPKHLASDCLKNLSQCDFCRERISKADEATHLQQCGKFPIACPSNCGIKEIPREKMENHLENECNKHETSCPFVECGCTFKALRAEMPKHLKDSPGIHLNLMCKTLALQKKQMQILTDIIEKQKSQLQAIANKTDTLNKFYGSQLIWKIDGYAEKFADCKSGKKPTIFSPAFLTSRHGYKLALSAALFGDGKAKGKYMSLFLCICKGEFDALLSWPFSHKITFTLLDQCEEVESRRHVSYTIKPNTCKENAPFLDRPTGDRNASFGAQKFVELDTLSSFDYICNDTMFIKVEIDSENMVLV